MARKSMVIKQQKSRSILHANTTDARFAADRMLIFASSVFAEFASVSLLIKARFQALRKLRGKPI